MTDQNSQPGRKPEFIAYNVRESQDGKGYWSRIGAAWPHRDGQGYDISLDSIPVDGRITLREQREERMRDYADQRSAKEPQEPRERNRDHGRQR